MINTSTCQSNQILMNALVKGLTSDGNKVTYITPHKSSNSVENPRVIHLENSLELDQSEGKSQVKNYSKVNPIGISLQRSLSRH